MRVVALIPAYQEEASIASTIEAVLNQRRVPDQVVVIPNGCTDQTAEIARQYPVDVLELPKLKHKKSEALNTAWRMYAQDADVVICLDADTILPLNAVEDWEKEIEANPNLAGSSSKFTMLPESKREIVLGQAGEKESWWAEYLTRLQANEFSAWTDTALRRGFTTVLAGTGCAISGKALREVAILNGDDMEESGWKLSAITPQTERGKKVSTRESGGMENSSERTGLLGLKLMGKKSQKGWLSDTSATIDLASTQNILNLGLNKTTSSTWLKEEDIGSQREILALGAGENIQRDLAVEEMNDGVRNAPTNIRKNTIEKEDSKGGPWSYKSLTEDFRITYRLRQLGYICQVSPTVRAYTDSMKTTKSLLSQRSKWQVGTVEDLLTIGVNKLTLVDWWQQFAGLFMAFVRVLWALLLVALVVGDMLVFQAIWWVVIPAIFSFGQGVLSLRVPHRDWKDTILAISILPSEHFAWLRSYWFVVGWFKAIKSKATGVQEDLWKSQHLAETK